VPHAARRVLGSVSKPRPLEEGGYRLAGEGRLECVALAGCIVTRSFFGAAGVGGWDFADLGRSGAASLQSLGFVEIGGGMLRG
jgi:hypothetical protein